MTRRIRSRPAERRHVLVMLTAREVEELIVLRARLARRRKTTYSPTDEACLRVVDRLLESWPDGVTAR